MTGDALVLSNDSDLKRLIIEHLGDDRLIARLVLLRLRQSGGAWPGDAAFLRFAFRLAPFLSFFEYLVVYAVLSRGRALRADCIGTIGLIETLRPALEPWIRQTFGGGDLGMPPVRDIQGTALISRVLDSAEGHLLAVGAAGEARNISEIRSRIDEVFQKAEKTWILSSTFVSHIGHVVFGAALIEMSRAGSLTDQPVRVVTGTTHNAFLMSLLAPGLIDTVPDGVAYAEFQSVRKRFARSDDRRVPVVSLVSEAAGRWSERAPFLTLPDGVRARGESVLEAVGIGPDRPVVTLHVREAGYNAAIARDMELRDADIATYRDAIEFLTGRGIAVVRLGDSTMARLESMEGVFDYPFSEAKSDWMDIYLAARCRFHIGTASGMSYVPLLFGRPVLFTNWVTLMHLISAPNVVTLTKALVGEFGQSLPLTERVRKHAHITERSDALLDGVSVRNNTPAEILEAVRLVEASIDDQTGKPIFPAGSFVPHAVFEDLEIGGQPQVLAAS